MVRLPGRQPVRACPQLDLQWSAAANIAAANPRSRQQIVTTLPGMMSETDGEWRLTENPSPVACSFTIQAVKR